ncbi:unnamed protein product, partial [Owenia fusiformis]
LFRTLRHLGLKKIKYLNYFVFSIFLNIDTMKSIRALTTLSRRAMSTQPLGQIPNNAKYKKLQELQKHFCRDDGKLVWQKMGTRDTMLFQGTMALTIFGVGLSLYKIFIMSFPQKSD